MRNLVWLLLCACAPEIPVEFCSENFRDSWWYIDTEVTDDLNIQPTCFYVSSDGYMETIHYDTEVSYESKWACVDDNEIRIKGRGRASFDSTEDSEVWNVDLNLNFPPVYRVAEVTPCWWADDFLGG